MASKHAKASASTRGKISAMDKDFALTKQPASSLRHKPKPTLCNDNWWRFLPPQVVHSLLRLNMLFLLHLNPFKEGHTRSLDYQKRGAIHIVPDHIQQPRFWPIICSKGEAYKIAPLVLYVSLTKATLTRTLDTSLLQLASSW